VLQHILPVKLTLPMPALHAALEMGLGTWVLRKPTLKPSPAPLDLDLTDFMLPPAIQGYHGLTDCGFQPDSEAECEQHSKAVRETCPPGPVMKPLPPPLDAQSMPELELPMSVQGSAEVCPRAPVLKPAPLPFDAQLMPEFELPPSVQASHQDASPLCPAARCGRHALRKAAGKTPAFSGQLHASLACLSRPEPQPTTEKPAWQLDWSRLWKLEDDVGGPLEPVLRSRSSPVLSKLFAGTKAEITLGSSASRAA